MIDLHIHSTHSDGTYNPIELLQKAEKLGLEIISITDHDNIDAHIELQNIDAKKYYNGKVITGIELKTAYKSVAIEILGYGVNAEKIKELMTIQAEAKRNAQIKYLEYLKSVGRNIGLKFDESVQVGEESIWAGLTFVNSIDKTEVNKEIIEKYNIGLNGDTFYRKCQSNPNNIFYIDETKDNSEKIKNRTLTVLGKMKELGYVQNEEERMYTNFAAVYDFVVSFDYEKNGYEVFAEIKDCPPGTTNYYLKKEF